MSVLFTSDLHLDASRSVDISSFVAFIDQEACHADALYILGDLFEAWIGDDDTDPALQPVVAALARLHEAGVPCAVMHGNRDFLLGRRFEQATGCHLLGDYEMLEIGDEKVLLTHGDLLCTDDTAYLSLRTMVRDPAWQAQFLGKTLDERRAMAEQLRNQSRSETAAKTEHIMDVCQKTVEHVMREYGVHRLIHGHTHRPAIHEFMLDGEPATRMVLGAWHDGPNMIRWEPEAKFSVEALPPTRANTGKPGT